MRIFKVEIQGCGHITIGITQAVIDELLSKDWADYMYTFHDEKEVIKNLARWMHLWPPGLGQTKHSLDGIAHLTTADLKIINDQIDFREIWEDVEISEEQPK